MSRGWYINSLKGWKKDFEREQRQGHERRLAFGHQSDMRGTVTEKILLQNQNDIVNFKRIICWWRGFHRESPTTGYFRYDVSGICSDCGKVGDGINHNDD